MTTKAIARGLIVTAAAVLLAGGAVRAARAQEAPTLRLTIKNHRFQPAEIKAPAGTPIILTIKNLDATPEEFESKTLRIEKIIEGGGETSVLLRALQPGRYKFFGEYHEATAQGALVVE